MTRSSGGKEFSGPTDADSSGQPPAPGPAHPPTEVASPDSPTEVGVPYSPTEVASPYSPTEAARPHPLTEVGSHGPGVPTASALGQAEPTAGRVASTVRPAEIVRHGPGVPVSSSAGQAGLSAKQVWRTGGLPEPPRGDRQRRLRRVASGALTVILLAAAGVVLYLRFHHASFRVTGVAITRQVRNGCAVDVTGRIATDGSAGTVSYQWLFQPQLEAPQPVSQSVVTGQDAVYVTAALEGQGHGSVARAVTLQVLGPGTGTALTHVVVSC